MSMCGDECNEKSDPVKWEKFHLSAKSLKSRGQKFSENLEDSKPQNSRSRSGDMKQVTYREAGKIWGHHTKFSCYGDLATGTRALLLKTVACVEGKGM